VGFFLVFYLLDTYPEYVSYLNQNFLGVTISLFAFVSIFYGIIVIRGIIRSINRYNQNVLRRLTNQIRSLSTQESNADSFIEKADICQQKIQLYGEMERISGRNLTAWLTKASLVYFSLMLWNLFAPSQIPIFKDQMVISLILFWFGVYYTLNIILLFYQFYHTRSS